MSLTVDCPGCQFGNHGQHKPDWGITPGLIGGQSCGCIGDCQERFEASTREIARWWGGAQETTTPVGNLATHATQMLDTAPCDWWRYVPCGYCNAARQQPCQAMDGPASRVHSRRYRAGLLLHGTFWLLANHPEDVMGK